MTEKELLKKQKEIQDYLEIDNLTKLTPISNENIVYEMPQE